MMEFEEMIISGGNDGDEVSVGMFIRDCRKLYVGLSRDLK